MDGFIYIFAVVGIAVTAASAALGIAVIVTMARLSYSRLMSVIPVLFSPAGVVGEQKVSVVREEAESNFGEKAHVAPAGRMEIALSK